MTNEKHDVTAPGLDKPDSPSLTVVGPSDTQSEITALDLTEDDAIDPVYAAKARKLNEAVQEMGMGKYQWEIFCLCAMGWAAENLYLITTSLILPSVRLEFRPAHVEILTLCQNVGLLIGAAGWSFGSDIIGRRYAFNITLLVTFLFALPAAGSNSFGLLCAFALLWSTGVGGNLPVDAAVFLEVTPASHAYLLVVLSVFWAVGQVIATLLGWPLLGNFSCEETATVCTKAENMGWRYLLICVGGLTVIMFILRFFCFTLYESPKYLMGKGLDAQAVEVIHKIAKKNGKTCSLTVADLAQYDSPDAGKAHARGEKVSAFELAKREIKKIDASHIKGLFAERKKAWSTVLLIGIWTAVGLGFPLYNNFLPFIQAQRGADFGDGSTYITYRNSLIAAVASVPGAFVGAVLCETKFIGRKGSLALTSFASAAMLFGSTTAKSSNALLGWNCGWTSTSAACYGLIFATVELFRTKDRGTGSALCSSANRLMGVLAPILSMTITSGVPTYIAGGFMGIIGVLALCLPIEMRDRQSL